jgi:hypothetical protein
MKSLAALALTSLTLGCVPDFGTDLSELREPRLLAIASDPAEAKGDKPVTLSALIAVPEGQSAPAPSWSLCLARKPLTELGPVAPACLEPDDGSGQVQALGDGDSVSARLDKEVCKLFGPLRPAPKAGEPAGRPVDPDITGGFYQPVVANLQGVASLGAIRIDCDPVNLNRDEAVAYRQQYLANENPSLSAVSLVTTAGDSLTLDESGEPVQVRAGSRLTVRASWNDCPSESACGDGYCMAGEDSASCAADCSAGNARGCTGAESYVWHNRETNRVEPRREGISVAWYASSGHFEAEQTGLTEREARSRQTTQNTWSVGQARGSATLWLVIRDTRGGQSWRTFHFSLTD